MLLKDKIVLVSGIGPGLGQELAMAAAREGAAGLIICARTASKLSDCAKAIAAECQGDLKLHPHLRVVSLGGGLAGGRKPNRQIAFITGIHVCLGATLARIEGRIAIGKLVDRFPKLAADGPRERLPLARFRGFTRLPVTVR